MPWGKGDSAQRPPAAEPTTQKVVREGVRQTFPKACGTAKAARSESAVAQIPHPLHSLDCARITLQKSNSLWLQWDFPLRIIFLNVWLAERTIPEEELWCFFHQGSILVGMQVPLVAALVWSAPTHRQELGNLTEASLFTGTPFIKNSVKLLHEQWRQNQGSWWLIVSFLWMKFLSLFWCNFFKKEVCFLKLCLLKEKILLKRFRCVLL